jgi:hypothetical protein
MGFMVLLAWRLSYSPNERCRMLPVGVTQSFAAEGLAALEHVLAVTKSLHLPADARTKGR